MDVAIKPVIAFQPFSEYFREADKHKKSAENRGVVIKAYLEPLEVSSDVKISEEGYRRLTGEQTALGWDWEI